MEPEIIINWITAASITLLGVYVGWYLNQRTMDKNEKKGKEEEYIKALSRMNMHLYNFVLIKSSFDHIVTEDAIKALRKKLEKWKSEFEVLCSEYAHYRFMETILELSPFFISKIDLILDADLNREQTKKLLDEIRDIHEDMAKGLKKFSE